MSSQRKWWRHYFKDHPLYITNQSKALRPAEVWANATKDKVRVFCKLCLEHAIGQAIQDEEDRTARGEQIIVRSRDVIELALFNVAPNQTMAKPEWIESRSETLLSHLRNCCFQSPEVRTQAGLGPRASAPHPDTGTSRPAEPMDNNSTPRTQRTYQVTIASPQPVRFHLNQPPPIAQWDSIPSQSASTAQSFNPNDPFTPGGVPSFYPSAPVPSMALPPGAASGSTGAPFIPGHTHMTQFTYDAINRMYAGSPAQSYISTNSSGGVGRSIPSVSRANTPGSYHSSKRQRTISGARRPSMIEGPSEWHDDRQQEFEIALMRLIASAGLSFNFVSNPEFLAFCQTFIPLAKVPSRKVLTYRVLPLVLRDIRTRIQARVYEQLVTVQCDGWTGPNSHHLIAFMVTTANGNVYTVKVVDTTVERKTAENLLNHMLDVLDILKREWRVLPIAFTTDASGESKKARRLLHEQQPNLVTPDCYAHQINLIVGDYFKTNNVEFLHFASQANDLITWLRSKTAVLGLIRHALESNGRRSLSVICPVPTRWTAYYLAYRRLLDLRTTLEYVIVDDARKPEDERLVIPKERAAREKAMAMVEVMKNDSFWLALARIKHHLAPLAIAANVTQSSHCRLDEVLLTFASLAMEYSKLTDTLDAEVKQALLASINKRWDQSDQEVFIAAVMLNPFIRTTPFVKDAQLISLGSIYLLLSGLWSRFYPKEAVPDGLYDEIQDYLHFTGFYSSMESVCDRQKARAASRGESPKPLDAYTDITIPGQQPPPLIRLAMHLLSICPNSASCERLFSTFGLILTKLRTRLNNQRVVDLAECKMHIRDEHIASEVKRNLRKRVFGARAENPTASSTRSSNPATDNSSNILPVPSSVPSIPIPGDAGTSTSSGSTRTTQSLRMLTSRHITMLDDIEDITVVPSGLATTTRNFRKRRIDQLFDFTSAHWIAFYQRGATGSLEDEMELYDLLDMDAEGDLDYDLDDCLESVLTV